MRGGVLEHGLRHLTVRCLAYMVPDSLVAKIGALDLDQALHVKEIEVPEGTEILNNPDAVVIRVVPVNAAIVVRVPVVRSILKMVPASPGPP